MTEKRIVALDPNCPAASELAEAAKLLEDGQLVVAPTETRYGLLARAEDEDALKRVFDAKGRGKINPTALFVNGIDGLAELGQMTPAATLLASRFLPGPMTLVLRSRKPWGPPRVVDGMIGLRWSSSKVIAALMGLVGFAVTATSANLAGQGELDTVSEIAGVFGDKVSLYLDGGALRNPTSTVVLCVDKEVTVLREGAISSQAVRDTLRAGGLA